MYIAATIGTMCDSRCSVDIARRLVVFGANLLLQHAVFYFQFSCRASLCFRLAVHSLLALRLIASLFGSAT